MEVEGKYLSVNTEHQRSINTVFSKNIELLRLAIKRSEDQGMLVIVASGNYESDRNNDIVPTFPSSFK
ncbi:hypothetical protein [Cryptosporidium hominis TU502]|uniref:hypothetical protein n=1 Tax=Cryptosporidium hominis (strain TU502) TaxID=353151 RepID=UPI0000452F8F|nr:hypothetical protein [Cryptosporidium hominis TU502]